MTDARLKRMLTWVSAMLIVVVAGFAAGCGDDDDDDSGGQETGTTGTAAQVETIEEGRLIVGSDIPYPPFEFGDEPDYEGFDIDIVREIGERLDLEVEIRDTPFDTIFRDLQQGRFDLVASATTITPEREQQVAFSVPYFSADQSLMVKRGSDIESVEDLSGRTVGAQGGTTGLEYARSETEAETVRRYPEIPDAFNALQNEQIEAVINDFAISKDAEREYEDLVVVERIDTDESYGLGMQKDATNLKDAVDAALEEMFQDGTYAEIYQRYLDAEPPEEFQR